MRWYFVNTAKENDALKTCEITPSIQLAWWRSGGNFGIFWMNFGVQIGVGEKFEDSIKNKKNEQSSKKKQD